MAGKLWPRPDGTQQHHQRAHNMNDIFFNYSQWKWIETSGRGCDLWLSLVAASDFLCGLRPIRNSIYLSSSSSAKYACKKREKMIKIKKVLLFHAYRRFYYAWSFNSCNHKSWNLNAVSGRWAISFDLLMMNCYWLCAIIILQFSCPVNCEVSLHTPSIYSIYPRLYKLSAIIQCERVRWDET